MPNLIKNGALQEDAWQRVEPDSTRVIPNGIYALAAWQQLADKQQSGVQLEPGDGIESLVDHLDSIAVVAINFPVFTDGRGFSYARELREKGYQGELRAVGHFIRDQLTYLSRVGFDAFQLEDETQLDMALHSLHDFSESYQACIDQPLPLFRRRQ